MKKMMITVIEVMIIYDVNGNGNGNYNRYIVIMILLTIMLRKWHAVLTHWGRVTHIFVGNLTIIGSDNGLALNQCWNIVNWTLRNKLQWNSNWNCIIFIQENALENVVWEMASILSRPQCVNKWAHWMKITSFRKHDSVIVDFWANKSLVPVIP